MRRILALVSIFILLLFTGMPMFTSNLLCNQVYADDGLSDQQKATLAISTYFNYRKGWYVGSAAGAVGLMKSYIDEFFNDSANNTGINSYSEFVSHVNVGKNSSGNWSVSIDNTGLVFLDHLVKWLLGKDKFPNLHSGGSWGSGKTNDLAYSGHLIGGRLVYYYDNPYNNSYATYFNAENMLESLLIKGNFVELNGKMAYNLMSNKYNYSWNYSAGSQELNQWNSAIYPETSDLTVQFYENYTLHYLLKVNYNSTNTTPRLYISYLESGNSYSGNNAGTTFYINNGVYSGIGEFVNIMFKGNNTRIYSGILFHNYNNDKYSFKSINYSDAANSSNSVSVNLDTDNFDKDDVGQADNNGNPVPDAPSKTFYPQYTTNEGDTYNYYNETNNPTVNNFYNNYISNYTTNTYNYYNYTIIYNNDNGGDGDDPTPGGTTPPWDGSDSGTPAGTLTPVDGGGYNFNLPDIGLPDLNIDWSINGLKEKFPFSIPWDLMAFFAVMNAEPETPYIQADIPLGLWEWNIDWDLHAFDNVARILRNMELIGFCIGLILITRSIIKG